MMRFLPVFFIFLLTALQVGIYTSPVYAQWGPLVPCGNEGEPECSICHVLALAQNVINFLVAASVLVAALMFLNAGVLYVLSPSNPGNIAKAHKLFTTTLIGIILVLAAWLIVNVVMASLYSGGEGWTDILDC